MHSVLTEDRRRQSRRGPNLCRNSACSGCTSRGAAREMHCGVHKPLVAFFLSAAARNQYWDQASMHVGGAAGKIGN